MCSSASCLTGSGACVTQQSIAAEGTRRAVYPVPPARLLQWVVGPSTQRPPLHPPPHLTTPRRAATRAHSQCSCRTPRPLECVPLAVFTFCVVVLCRVTSLLCQGKHLCKQAPPHCSHCVDECTFVVISDHSSGVSVIASCIACVL